MVSPELAYQLVTLFNQKVTSTYYSSFNGDYGRNQIDTLSWLYAHPQIRAMELAERMNSSKQHISKIISRFEAEGLVERIPDPSDGRAELLELTEAGKALIEEHTSISDQHFCSLLHSLSEEEASKMNEAMKMLIDILEEV